MRVFVAGATGAIGRPLVRRLLEAGHDVTAMTRSPERAEALRALDADAVVADALDAPAVTRAIGAARPEALVNQLTDLPARIDLRRYRRDLAGTNRLRRETWGRSSPTPRARPAATAVEGRGAANAKARRELGWAPAHPSIREGFPAVFGAARAG